MRNVFMKSLGLAAIAFAATAAFGCQDHFSTQDAYATCETLEDRNPGNPQSSFEDCVACYETCGGDCQQAGTSPETYVCPDELGEGGGGEGGSGEGGSE